MAQNRAELVRFCSRNEPELNANGCVYVVVVVVVTDVRAAVRRRKSGPRVADLEAAEGKDSGDPRGVRQTVPGVPRALAQAHPHLPQVMSETAQMQGPPRLASGKCLSDSF